MAGPMLFRSVRLQEFNGLKMIRQNDSIQVIVQPDGFVWQEMTGRNHKLSFMEVLSLEAGSYQLRLRTAAGSDLIFSQLGFDYEAFIFQAFSAWNHFVGQALYLDEPCLLEVKGDYIYQSGRPADHGMAEHNDQGTTRFCLYDSSLMVFPQNGMIRRVPLCLIDVVEPSSWQIRLVTQQNDQWTIRRLGHDQDAFALALSQALQRQTDRALDLLRQITTACGAVNKVFSGPDNHNLTAAAWLLREGRAADPAAIDQVCPGLMPILDKILRQWSPDGYYGELAEQAQAAGCGRPIIGIRREQATDALAGLSPDHAAAPAIQELPPADTGGTDDPGQEPLLLPAFWLIVPIRSNARTAAALEVIASQPLAQATYIFGCPPEPSAWPFVWRDLNLALEAVDFRREAIYLSAADLAKPERQRDLAALRFCPALSTLRDQYLGRIIHRGLSGWRDQLRHLVAKGV